MNYMYTSLISASMLSFAASAAAQEEAPTQRPPDVEPQLTAPPRQWALTLERGLSVPTHVALEGVTIPVPGIGASWRVSESFGLQAMLAFGRAQSSQDTPLIAKGAQTVLAGSLRAYAFPLRLHSFRVGVFGGAGYRIAFSNTQAGTASQDRTTQGFGVELGVRPEWFANDRISLHTAFGTSVRWSREDGGKTTLSFGFAGDLITQCGVSIWF
jgi:hypothetical protein